MKDYYKLLDDTLSAHIPRNNKKATLETSQLSAKMTGFTDDEHREANERLKKDEYLRPINPSMFLVSLKGYQFLQEGGYQGEQTREAKHRKDQAHEKNRQASNEQRLTDGTEKLARWTQNLTYGTWAIVLATLCLVVVEIAKEHKVLGFCHCPGA